MLNELNRIPGGRTSWMHCRTQTESPTEFALSTPHPMTATRQRVPTPAKDVSLFYESLLAFVAKAGRAPHEQHNYFTSYIRLQGFSFGANEIRRSDTSKRLHILYSRELSYKHLRTDKMSGLLVRQSGSMHTSARVSFCLDIAHRPAEIQTYTPRTTERSRK